MNGYKPLQYYLEHTFLDNTFSSVIMIIAAIDISFSIERYLDSYRDRVSQVLFQLKTPIRIILWNEKVVCETDIDNKNDLRKILNFEPTGGTLAKSFIQVLPSETPIDLYVFTDGQLESYDIDDCCVALEKSKVQISRVSLHYIGIESEMELQFTSVFQNFPYEIFIQDRKIAAIDPKTVFDFKDVDYEYIMKDDSFKARIIALVRDYKVDKVQLKSKVLTLMNSILKRHLEFNVKNSIHEFYENKDISGCAEYIKKHSYYNEKAEFQRKIAAVLKLFDKNINIYGIDAYADVPAEPDDLIVDIEEEELQSEDSECLTCDILYDVCNIACIPIKMCKDAIWPDKSMIQNPFRALESEEWIKGVLDRVEPFVLDFNKTYKNLRNRNLSPFSRDFLKGVYILLHPKLNVDAIVKHNNHVLSNYFVRKLPGKPVLWHVVFLYLVATRKFPEHKEVFFRHIRLLCQREKYYVSLIAHLNPPIVEPLQVCFWYVACVCPVVWPNNKKNVLRKADFVSGKILDFYRDVYDPQYEQPKDMHLWQLWYALCREKTAIFRILSRYFRHERVDETDFGIILYRERLQPSQPINLETVLKIYSQYRQARNPDFYKDLSDICNVDLPAEEKELLGYRWKPSNDDLEHIRINLETCHPYLFCPTTGKYWRECAGKYDQMKESYLRLFKRYCKQYGKYPEKSADLMVFLNKFIFDRTQIPELFDLNLSRDMKRVLENFKEVVAKYTCKEYIKISNAMSSECVRARCEKTMYGLSIDKVIKLYRGHYNDIEKQDGE